MPSLFTRICALTMGLFGLLNVAQAQYVFKSTPDASIGSKGLAPYEQNFDALSGTNAQFVNNQTLRGVYATFTLNSYPNYEIPSNYSGKTIPADNGSKGASLNSAGQPNGAGWYHFGSNTINPTDRALGGIAATTTDKGVGYLGIRLRNNSGVLIKNLDISYAMEQWYNSGKLDKAEVKVAFRKLTANDNGSLIAGEWKDISELAVKAPSTEATITNSDGNSSTNRRVKRAKLFGDKTDKFGAGLADGEDIMIRWSYIFDTDTNGNGLSLDDVVISPETKIFYSKEKGSLSDLATWGINADGTGTAPTSFTSDNTTYYVRGNALLIDRLPTGATLQITGSNSRLVVGTPDKEAALYVSTNDNIKAIVNVEKKSTLQIENNNSAITLGSLDNESLVEYITPNGGATQYIKGGHYGKIKFTRGGDKVLAGSVIVSNKAEFDDHFFVPLRLQEFDFTLLKEAELQMDKVKALFVTDGKGGLRQTVDSKGHEVTFQVAATADQNDQTRVILSQDAPNSEDTYKVRVINGAYASYDANEVPYNPISKGVVTKTWFISEEVVGGSDIAVQTFWNKKDEAPGFDVAKAYVDHYSKSKNSWDNKKDSNDEDVVLEPKAKKKKGVKNFSPFGVTSATPVPLPVQLVRFDAQRKGTAVVCNWATAVELNNAYFEVERKLEGQTSFRSIGRVIGAGTSSQGRTYTFSDEQPSVGVAYYRLRQVDTDGTLAFSPVVMVASNSKAAVVSVVPNPSAGRFELLTNLAQPTRLQGSIFNAMGRQIIALDKSVTAGPSSTQLDLSNQPAGIYILQLRTPQALTTIRMVKQ
ncbi:T9SS type A sorting domain-containing protein [Hymenobacter taeanensis]|uniref:T9SS type A sorting domain-containing protein n=1 Tax=Hymenobacter taeanensis TaxID=2735321 RepID=A0A6M6BEM0_9BACT|nr:MULTISPECIES: T9SS type A sorting domain-containing protein [Hymenobacter]QJX46460.1 T9SS type A sorting domain-containing protein [Hymenobacter taeanensis]UOQ80324.1 T9SS type A sorting domain-containing protein [Hymenobacter sp. 5414T-23]